MQTKKNYLYVHNKGNNAENDLIKTIVHYKYLLISYA